MSAQQQMPTRGRPRDNTRDEAIHRATLDLLGELGYSALSIGAVARRAGVSKATIYRRWSGKAEVVGSALQARTTVEQPPAADSLRDSLLVTLKWLAQDLVAAGGSVIASVLIGMREDPELASQVRRILRRDESDMITRVFGAARDREPLVPDAERLFLEIAPAVVTHRTLIANLPCDAAFLEHVVDDILIPLLVANPRR
ncbi:MAG TPA: TetR/AcrR family transcriptional regulator [Solirubrobacteraceae bacterium]|nr:TetR/AcrR family transcriptional regulator [Solirubrobacteraceae bacterium]